MKGLVRKRNIGEEDCWKIEGGGEIGSEGGVEMEVKVEGWWSKSWIKGMLGMRKRRVGGIGKRIEKREVGEGGEDEKRNDDRIEEDIVRKKEKNKEEEGEDKEGNWKNDVGRMVLKIKKVMKEEEGVKM